MRSWQSTGAFNLLLCDSFPHQRKYWIGDGHAVHGKSCALWIGAHVSNSRTKLLTHKSIFLHELFQREILLDDIQRSETNAIAFEPALEEFRLTTLIGS